VRVETHHRGIGNLNKIPSLNVQRTDLCQYLSTDMLIVPLIRKIFDLEKFCPIAKVHLYLIIKKCFTFV